MLGAEATRVLEMARAFAIAANYASAVVLCFGHGSPAPRNPRRRARTGRVDRIHSAHHGANVGDSEVSLLEVGCADALVLRRLSLEDNVLELTVHQSLWRVAGIETFAARIKLIQEFVRILIWIQSR